MSDPHFGGPRHLPRHAPLRAPHNSQQTSILPRHGLVAGSRTGAQGVHPRTRFWHFSYAAVYELVTSRGEVRVPRNTLGLVIAVLVIILLIYLILQFI